jgi:hypothetical protein
VLPVPPEAISFAIDYILGKALDVGASVIASRSRPVLARVLGQRFAGGVAGVLVGGPDLITAKERLRAFLEKLDLRIRKLEAASELDSARLDELFARPEVTAALMGAFESAMETDDVFVRATLADLVVARLRAPDGSFDGVAARFAAERMRDVTPTQTRLLAFIVVLHIDPMAGVYRTDAQYDEDFLSAKREEYIRWLARYADPLVGLPVEYSDFTHLRGLGLLDFTMWEHTSFESGFTPPPLNAVPLLFPDLWNEPRVAGLIRMLQDTADPRERERGLPMMAACTLTPAGYLIGSQALNELVIP